MTAEIQKRGGLCLFRSVLAICTLALAACQVEPATVDVDPMDQDSALGADVPTNGDRNSENVPEAPDVPETPDVPLADDVAHDRASTERTDPAAGHGTENAETVAVTPGDPADTPPHGTEDVGSNRISDEQDFDAVSNRQTIESDAARLRARREAYTEIRYGDLPDRGDVVIPNVVAFALSTDNDVGERIWPRLGIMLEKRYERNCAIYANENFAQEAFLANGGPERNWQGLDPDGDGFACGWDPSPFRDTVAAAR